jgi:DNA repair protein RecN (Recombination protein N)
MLKSLYISNYALISELKIDFGKGFSAITGETGAGKSIILGALSLILGQRAESKAVKPDVDKCVIEAEFDLNGYYKLADFFKQNDIDIDDSGCIIRREITGAGKSRAFVNDTPVSLIILRELTSKLIDIHSQHDNLLLSNLNYQLEVVDTIARNQDLHVAYQEKFYRWQQLQSDLRKMEQNAGKYASEIDFIRFQHQQLTEAKLTETEQDELETELETLTHAEEIKTELHKTVTLLDEEDAVLPQLKDILVAINKVKTYIPDGTVWIERLDTVYVELKDINNDIASFAEKVEYNPERLEYVQGRLSEIYTLQKKYKVSTVTELIAIRNDFETQLQRIDSYDDDIELLRKNVESALNEMKAKAAELTQSRHKAVKPIENYLTEHLSKLGMPNIRFGVDIRAAQEHTLTGADEIQFLFSANKNREMQPVQLIASGGEVSRLMLTIKAMIANKSDLPTIIFDEIDTGVSGEIAHRMGEIMQSMSKAMQVITITHLPQIAAKSNQHYRVYKDESGEQTRTFIERLSQEQRVGEIAQMLSGKNPTEAAILNARELLGN